MMDATFVYGVQEVLAVLFIVLLLALAAFAWLDAKTRRIIRRGQRNVWPIGWWRKRLDRKEQLRATIEAYKIASTCLRDISAQGMSSTHLHGPTTAQLAQQALNQSIAALRTVTDKGVPV